MIFISYNSKDWPSVEVIVNELGARKLNLALDRRYLEPGSAITDLGVTMENCTGIIAFYGAFGLGPWQKGEIDLGWKIHANNSKFRFVPVVLPEGDLPSGFPSSVIYSDLRKNLTDQEELDRLAGAFRAAGSDGHPMEQPVSSQPRINPYRSLLPFREEDAQFFFGRDQQITKLVDLIGVHRFLAVVAASGSGKSSLVMAGLVPKLRKDNWGIVRIVPTSDPWRSLAAELVPVWQPNLRGADMLLEILKVEELLSTRRLPVKEVLLQIVNSGRFGRRFLLIVDQWEELYSLCKNDQVRTDFIDDLLDAAEHESLSMLLTLRGDFYAHALQHRRLADELDQKNVNLGPLKREEMKEIIEKPAQRVGTHFQDGLVESILDEVGAQDSALPLLEYLLTQMWDLKKGDELTFDAYIDLGKLEGAIAQSAEDAWKKLSESQEPLAEALLLRLVQLNVADRATRRRARADELSDEQMEIARMFANHRILVTSRDPATADVIVEVAHEALLARWDRFTGLIRKQREFLLWRRRLEFSCTQYYDVGQEEEAALLKGLALAEATKWIGLGRESLSEKERVFIDRSVERDRIERGLRQLDNEFVEHQSDDALLAACEKTSDQLWPSYPEKIPELEKLRTEVRELLNTLPDKENLLGRIEASATGQETPKVRWQIQTLSKLIQRLKETGSEKGLSQQLDQRIEDAASIVKVTITDQADNWKRAIAEIQASPKYHQLTLSPQIGLVPLGFAPGSGLAEFLHFQSHEGEIPARASDGAIPFNPLTGIILVLLPGGTFHMGAQNISRDQPNYDPRAESLETPVHEVTLAPFFISKYLLTQGQWERLTNSNPSRYRSSATYDNYTFTPLHPVESIPWRKASAALYKLALEIPTEAQWEYAARAGTDTVYWTGDDEASIMRGAHLLFNRMGLKRHAPVGSYDPNAFGLYDVLGNLWEFTRDWACFFNEPWREGDGLRGASGVNLIIRGASFFNSAVQSRIAYRTDDITPDMVMSWMGVRPARAIESRFANEEMPGSLPSPAESRAE